MNTFLEGLNLTNKLQFRDNKENLQNQNISQSDAVITTTTTTQNGKTKC